MRRPRAHCWLARRLDEQQPRYQRRDAGRRQNQDRARITILDSNTQTLRITPAGKLDRGMPNWWFLRVDQLDPAKPLLLEVVARDVQIPVEGNAEGKNGRL